jgi:hypothetical protein
MDRVPYGSSGEKMGRIGLGCMGMSGYAGAKLARLNV